jgi:DDE superfamily endonuclease
MLSPRGNHVVTFSVLFASYDPFGVVQAPLFIWLVVVGLLIGTFGFLLRLFYRVWQEQGVEEGMGPTVAEELGEPDGVLMFDETGFVKKGKDSVGVARQYCGSLGKVENGQVGVFAGCASRQGYALVDKCLFLPDVWFTEAYTARRAKCQVPPEVGLCHQTAVGSGDAPGHCARGAAPVQGGHYWTPYYRCSP